MRVSWARSLGAGPDLAPRARRHRPAATAATAATAAAASPLLSVELPTRDTQASLQLEMVPAERGRAILIAGVAEGSAAEAAGVRPGMRLLKISDPVRLNELWELGDRSSLKYVQDAVRLRRGGTIALVLAPPAEGGAAAAPAAAGPSGRAAAPPPPAAPANGGQTIGERAAALYREQQAAPDTARERRRLADERMEQQAGRNDAPLFAGLAALFLFPALAILAAAQASGYLDALAAGSGFGPPP
jgi:hypothetical protein